MSAHLEETLQRDSDRIRSLIARMTGFAVRTLRDCVVALEKGDQQLCSIIILRDQRVDQMEKEIDRLALEFLLRHQPAGAHLRFASAALQINFQLERVGDYAESIARQVLKLVQLRWPVPADMLTDISSASISMLRNAVAAFVRQDPALAGATAETEERVDVLRNQVNSELMHLVQTTQMPLAALTPLMTIARRFERVSDQAKGICQETIYLCTGEYAKHQGSHVYRVLFVDDHHGCLSRMAQAIGQALNRPEFQFASAGLQPHPLAPTISKLFQQKGLRTPEQGLKPVPGLPEFHQFQIVVALSETVAAQLPPASRKSAQFHWPIADPCAGTDGANVPDAAFAQAHGDLTTRITGLVTALLAEDQTEPQH